jgi:hypothetical protein
MSAINGIFQRKINQEDKEYLSNSACPFSRLNRTEFADVFLPARAPKVADETGVYHILFFVPVSSYI